MRIACYQVLWPRCGVQGRQIIPARTARRKREFCAPARVSHVQRPCPRTRVACCAANLFSRTSRWRAHCTRIPPKPRKCNETPRAAPAVAPANSAAAHHAGRHYARKNHRNSNSKETTSVRGASSSRFTCTGWSGGSPRPGSAPAGRYSAGIKRRAATRLPDTSASRSSRIG